MPYFFSPSLLGFWDDPTAPSAPGDLVPISDEAWALYSEPPAAGFNLGVDGNGLPCWIQQPPAPPPSVIPFGDLLARFTEAENDALFDASRDDRTIYRWITLRSSGRVDLTADETEAAFAAMVTASVITTQRKTEILTP